MAPDREQQGSGKSCLYHSTILAPEQLVGGVLTPQRNRTLTGQAGDLVFATSNLLESFLYSIKVNPYMLQCGDCDGTAFAVVAHRSDYLKELSAGWIYPVSSDTFANVRLRNGQPTNEWVSTTPVKVDPRDAIKVDGIDAVMQRGAQVFFLADGLSPDQWADIRMSCVNESHPLNLIHEMVAAGLMIHENRNRNINPLTLDTYLATEETRSVVKNAAAALGRCDSESFGASDRGRPPTSWVERTLSQCPTTVHRRG